MQPAGADVLEVLFQPPLIRIDLALVDRLGFACLANPGQLFPKGAEAADMQLFAAVLADAEVFVPVLHAPRIRPKFALPERLGLSTCRRR